MAQFLTKIPNLSSELDGIMKKVRQLSHDQLSRQPVTKIIDDVLKVEGKMMRPALVLLCGRIGPNYPKCSAALQEAGAAIELTHLTSLIHDDIVDDAQMRRGRPSVQSSYGKDMAVYAGDFLLSKVLGVLVQPSMSSVGGVMSRAISDMCSGEISQYEAQFNVNTDESHYFMSISGKTAALFSASCEIGATISGCSGEIISCLRRFGHTLGILFQLRDDYIDCSVSSSIEAGKHTGVDFASGIYTLPVLYSFLEPNYGPALKELAIAVSENRGGPDADAQFTKLVNDAGGLEYTLWTMRQYHERATSLLEQLPKGLVADALVELARKFLDV